ncbi:MAG: inorganic phosphate transporter, partial [Kiloniellales bacterium]
EAILAGAGLPTIPLVPVSSSQAVVGAVLGIGLLRGGRAVRWRVLGGIGFGWLVTPIIAGVVCFVGLFFMQNVFNQEVYRAVPYELSQPVLERLERDGVATGALAGLEDKTFESAVQFGAALDQQADLAEGQRDAVLRYAEIKELAVDPARVATLDTDWLSPAQFGAVRRLEGRRFRHKWMLAEALAEESEEWRFLPTELVNKIHNKELGKKLDSLYSKFEVRP